MPETRFRIRWPDGAVEECYSPSTIIRDHLNAGDAYPVARFAELALAGLQAANARVRARFGMGCSQALIQMAAIRAAAIRFAGHPEALVHVEAFLP
ncbi:putative repeat protein (TIGR04042 family) [Novosphingobium sp. SG751A]|uniref:MSMEG_0570 family nitrogen starvation response protein n=1 Tax=Novosphingobium sp. SG751A TaxID=2587000 RepID=UPI0015577FCC|nr:MSMEG_0570 family nitrogen starvation response protein [Novosphingobium sp. SG751A]NOW47746.1 putative repeat protein (TIGR04042 family) [Novosphingobium sp. SG751A]